MIEKNLTFFEKYFEKYLFWFINNIVITLDMQTVILTLKNKYKRRLINDSIIVYIAHSFKADVI